MRKSKSVMVRARKRVGGLVDVVLGRKRFVRRVRKALRKFPRIG